MMNTNMRLDRAFNSTIKKWVNSQISWTKNAFRYFIIIFYYDVAPGGEITPCNKIDKPLVVYRFSGNVMKSIATLRT